MSEIYEFSDCRIIQSGTMSVQTSFFALSVHFFAQWHTDHAQDNLSVGDMQGGRTWQPFVGSKNGNENFRQARIYNFRVKCVVFARNRKFAKINSVKYALYTM